MRTKLIVKIILFVMLTTLILIGYSKQNTPYQVVDSYFTKMKNSELTDIFVENAGSDIPKEAMENYLNKITVKIDSENLQGENATVNIKVTGPNLAGILLNTYKQLELNDLLDKENMAQNMDEILVEESKKCKFEVREGQLNLIKKDDIWSIKEDESFYNLILGSTFYIAK